MKKTVVAGMFVAAAMVCFSAAAQLSPEYANYFDGPEGFLLTKEENKALKEITSDAEAKEFIDLFWAKRDPNLETPINEFQQDFNMRVVAADKAFGYEGMRGALTDRGKVLILFGRFDRRDFRSSSAVRDNVGGSGSVGTEANPGISPGRMMDEGQFEVWEYMADKLPVEVKQQRVFAYFVETKMGRNDYFLDRSIRQNTRANRLLFEIPLAMVKNPDLTEVPRFGLLPKTKPASAQQLAWFAGEGNMPDGAKAVAVEGLVAGPRHYIWTYLFLPEGMEADRLVGRLKAAGEAGDEVGSFVLNEAPKPAAGGTAFELGIQVEKGSWQLDLAAASASGPVAVTSLTAQTTEAGLEDTAISPIYWGGEPEKNPGATLGDPFNIGGWHLLPFVKDEFAPTDDISYMAYVLNPTLDEESGEPKLRLSMSLYKDDEQLTRQPPQPVPLSEVAPGLWMFGGGLPLQIFKQSGEYVLRLRLREPSSDTSRELRIPLKIVAPDGGASTEGQ